MTFLKKTLAFLKTILYTITAVALIAMKREVAVRKWQVFRGANVKLRNWRQVTVSQEVYRISRNVEITGEFIRPHDTPGKVYSHRLSY